MNLTGAFQTLERATRAANGKLAALDPFEAASATFDLDGEGQVLFRLDLLSLREFLLRCHGVLLLSELAPPGARAMYMQVSRQCRAGAK